MISSIDLFLRRDCAEGAGPAVEVAKPLLAVSPGVPDAAPGAAVDVAPGAEEAAVEAAGLPKSEGAAVLVVVPPGAAVDVASCAGVALLPLLNKEKPEVAVVPLGAAPDEGAEVPVVAPSDDAGF
jgi:hypothetical protein